MERRALFVAIVIGLASATSVAQDSMPEQELELPGVDIGMDEFLAYLDAIATTPEGAAAVFVLAMLLREADPGLGHDAMVVALDAGELRTDADGYRGYTLGNRAGEFVSRYLDPRPYLARSYVLGTAPGDGYELPATLRVRLSRNRSSEIADDQVKVFVDCSGADTPRPITLKRNNRGIWKAYEYSSLFVGIRPPVVEADDPL